MIFQPNEHSNSSSSNVVLVNRMNSQPPNHNYRNQIILPPANATPITFKGSGNNSYRQIRYSTGNFNLRTSSNRQSIAHVKNGSENSFKIQSTRNINTTINKPSNNVFVQNNSEYGSYPVPQNNIDYANSMNRYKSEIGPRSETSYSNKINHILIKNSPNQSVNRMTSRSVPQKKSMFSKNPIDVAVNKESQPNQDENNRSRRDTNTMTLENDLANNKLKQDLLNSYNSLNRLESRFNAKSKELTQEDIPTEEEENAENQLERITETKQSLDDENHNYKFLYQESESKVKRLENELNNSKAEVKKLKNEKIALIQNYERLIKKLHSVKQIEQKFAKVEVERDMLTKEVDDLTNKVNRVKEGNMTKSLLDSVAFLKDSVKKQRHSPIQQQKGMKSIVEEYIDNVSLTQKTKEDQEIKQDEIVDRHNRVLQRANSFNQQTQVKQFDDLKPRSSTKVFTNLDEYMKQLEPNVCELIVDGKVMVKRENEINLRDLINE